MLKIAGGIVLGYLIIKVLPELRDLADKLLNWTFDGISAVFKFFYNCWKWLDNSAWYYKLGVFLIVSFILLWCGLIECWGWFLLLYSYFPARWIYNLGHKE